MTTAMHEVTSERKRAEAEAAKLAKMEEVKQTAIAAAKKKLEEDKQLAEASAIATVACELATIAGAGGANREAADEDNAAAKKAVSKFCSCSSSSFFFLFFRFAFSHCNAVCADGEEKKRTDC